MLCDSYPYHVRLAELCRPMQSSEAIFRLYCDVCPSLHRYVHTYIRKEQGLYGETTRDQSKPATKHSPVSHCHRTANLQGFAMLTSNSTFVTSACFAAAIRGVLPYASLELKSSGFSFNNWITAFTLPALETLCNAVGNTAWICTHGVNGRTSRVSIHVGGSRAGWKTSSDWA